MNFLQPSYNDCPKVAINKHIEVIFTKKESLGIFFLLPLSAMCAQ